MNEKEPRIDLELNGEVVEVGRENGALFTFLGRLALYSHILVLPDPTKDSGFYIFKDYEVYEELADFFMEEGYPCHLNNLEVTQRDIDAYERHIRTLCSDVKDTIPDDWK